MKAVPLDRKHGEVEGFLRGIFTPILLEGQLSETEQLRALGKPLGSRINAGVLEDLLAQLKAEGIVTLQDVEDMIKNDKIMQLYNKGIPISVLTLLVDFYTARIYTTSGHYYGKPFDPLLGIIILPLCIIYTF